MRYRIARIALAGALVAGVAPMLATPASANCSTLTTCSSKCSDPENPSCLCVDLGPVGTCGFFALKLLRH